MANIIKAENAHCDNDDTGQEAAAARSETRSKDQADTETNDTHRVPVTCIASNVLSHLDQHAFSELLTMPVAKLRERFHREATCHRAMLGREKKGFVVHIALRRFSSFLALLGPMPTRNATIDRIDPSDPEYAPGKIRWADKVTQTRNRKNTILISNSNGQPLTATQLAERVGAQPDTIRKRRRRGWTDEEIILGKRGKLRPSPQPAIAEPVKVGLVASATDRRDRGRWFAIFKEFSPSDEEMYHIEKYLERKRSPPPSAKQADFDRMAGYCSLYRADFGKEVFPDVYEDELELVEQLCREIEGLRLNIGPPMTREKFDKRCAEKWPQYRPHILFKNLTAKQVDQLRRIDPGYVSEQEALLAKNEEKVRGLL